MTLQIAIYESPETGRLLADWTELARDVEFATNAHGFASLSAFILLSQAEAFRWFDQYGLPWIQVNAAGPVAWEGRLEDVDLVDGGIRVTALGAWSAFGDLPHSGSPGTLSSDVIVKDLLDEVLIANPDMLSDSEMLIEDPGVDVYDEDYEDASMIDILNKLAGLGDSMTPPRVWEVGVWEGRRVHFRPRGSAGQAWYIDAMSPQIQRSLSQVYNSVYTRYDGGALTTTPRNDTGSIARYGLMRQLALSSDTTNSGQAERERNAAVEDQAHPIPRASVPIDLVFNGAGSIVPKWMVRSGDTMTIRNLPPDAGTLIDRIRTFLIAETRYRPDGDVLEITPESPLPMLDVLVARAMEVPTV
jgi:hypothetical protein